jgi:hypothetical protein
VEEITLAAAIFSASQVAKPVVETGVRLIENLLGRPFRVAGNLLADEMYYWQWVNRIKIAARAQEIMDENAVAARVVPKGFILPLVDIAGNVDEPDLQELFAHLIANGAADEKAQRRQFAETLKMLSAEDARFFIALARMEGEAFHRFASPDAENADDERAGRLMSLGLLELVTSGVLERREGQPSPFSAVLGLDSSGDGEGLESPSNYDVRLYRAAAQVSLFGFQFFKAISPRKK